MDAKRQRLRRRQLDAQFGAVRVVIPARPGQGWIRAIRESLGIPATMLAKKLNVMRRNLYRLEEAEISGSISVNKLNAVADALNCDLVVMLIPRESLETTVQRQAISAARKTVARSAHSMALEDQALEQVESNSMVQELAREMLDRGDPRIWE